MPDCVRVLELMKARRVSPNGYTLTALMNAFINAGELKLARMLLNEKMDSSQLAALYNAYASALSSGGEAADVVAATDAMQSMLRLGLPARVAVMNSYLHSLCTCNTTRVQEALECVRHMLAHGPAPDSYTYSILFTMLGKQGLIEDALQFYTSSKDSMVSALDSTAMNSLFRAFVCGPLPIQALQLYEQLVAHNHRLGDVETFVPDKVTFTILFLALARTCSPSKVCVAEDIPASPTVPPPNLCATVAVSDTISLASTASAAWTTLVLDETLGRFYESRGSSAQEGTDIATTRAVTTREDSREMEVMSPEVADALLSRLYREMRFEYNIDVDKHAITALNKLFSIYRESLEDTLTDAPWLAAQRYRGKYV